MSFKASDLIPMMNPNQSIAIIDNLKQKYVISRTINAMTVGITRHDYDRLKHIDERGASVLISVEQELSSDKVETRTWINWSLNYDLFGTTDIRKALDSGDGTLQERDAQETSIINDTTPEQGSRKRIVVCIVLVMCVQQLNMRK